MTAEEYGLDFERHPISAIMGEVWGIFCLHFVEIDHVIIEPHHGNKMEI